MGSEKKVLLLGKKRPSITHFTQQLQLFGVQTTHVQSVEDAKKQLMRQQQIGLILVVWEESEEWIRELVFLYRGTPVLALSDQSGGVHDARRAIDAGAADYLLLPLEKNELAAALERYTNSYFDPELGRGRRLVIAAPVMKRLLTQARRAARSKATILIQGESGTGKELIARYVHQVSDRDSKTFIAVNCAALPENLLESELFGHVRGAFTGAVSDRKGKFQQAHQGTLFLDEISEMDIVLQAKLLRVLQEGEVDPVGSKKSIPIDVRLLASTNRDLKTWVSEGRFREDLFYRLNVFPIMLPPLRERSGDILLLAETFRKRFIKELGRNDLPFSREALTALNRYLWPGNIRELENVVQRALLIADGTAILPEDLMIEIPSQQPSQQPPPPENHLALSVGTTVREMEEILIRRTLDEVQGNRTQAARLLGISIRTLRNKLNEYADRVTD